MQRVDLQEDNTRISVFQIEPFDGKHLRGIGANGKMSPKIRYSMAPKAILRFTQLVILIQFLGGFGAFSQAKDTNDSIAGLAELRSRLETHLAQRKFSAAMWGVQVVSLDTGAKVFEHNPGKLFSPASNTKLYTVAAALDRLGADYRIATSLYATAKPNRRGVLEGDLVIYGRGDPTLNARLHGGAIMNALEPLVRALTNAGVKRIKGDLVADESFFSGAAYGSGWSWDDPQYYYGAEISALTINDNTFAVSVTPGPQVGAACKLELIPQSPYLVLSNRTETAEAGTRRSITFYRPLEQNVVYVTGKMAVGAPAFKEEVAVHRPAGLFLAWFQEAVKRQGIKVSGRSRLTGGLEDARLPADCEGMIELGRIESPPLREIAREIQKPSQNLYTDLLLAHLGEKLGRAGNSRAKTSEDLGIAELEKFLRDAGVERGQVFFEEGSGLSRNNLTTPNATVQLLRFMDRHAAREAFLDALPIAGVDGTLRNRMKGTIAAGNVRAKTGTLRWANSLSGYVTTRAGERLAFSIMLNRYQNSDLERTARLEIDDMAVMLAALASRSDAEP